MSSDIRKCEVCSSAIPSWKAKNVTVCGVRCRFERQEQKRKKAQQAKRKVTPTGFVVFHNCLYGAVDPFVPGRCRCRKTMSEDEAKNLVDRGEALDLESRAPQFTGGSIVQIGKKKKTPRSMTIERSNVERAFLDSKQKRKDRNKTIEELQRAVAEDRALREEEEKLRLKLYGDMRNDVLGPLIRAVPAEQYDRQKQEVWGRPGILLIGEDERTCVGKDVTPISFGDEEIDEQTEQEIEEQEPAEDDRTAEEVIAEHENAVIARRNV